MGWVYLDDQFPDHPKVTAAGGDAAWLFVCGLAYARRYNTGGRIPAAQVPKLSDRRRPRQVAAVLVRVGLWEPADDGFQIHDYPDWNRSSESRSEAGRKGAAARWQGHGSANGNRMADASSGHVAQDAQFPFPIPDPGSRLPATHDGSAAGLEEDEVLRALTLLAERAMKDRGPRAKPISDRSAWLRRAISERRNRHAAAIAELPDGLSADEIAALLEPDEPGTNEDQLAAAAAATRRRSQLPPCEPCDSTGWVDGDPAKGKCGVCRRLLPAKARAKASR